MNIGMEYAENATIPVRVRVFIVVWCKNHDVSISGVGVEWVMIPAKVVSGVINTKNFVSVYGVLLNNNRVAFFDSEIKFVTVIIMS